MHRVTSVEENRWRARAAQRRGNLLPDETGLADAAEHDLAGVPGDEVDGLRKGAVEPRGEFGERGSFSLEESTGGVQGSGHGKREYGV